MSAILSTILCLTLLGARSDGPDRSEPVTVRVLTYNVHHGEGRDGRLDLGRIAAVMRRARPDVVALQEVDRWTGRAGGVDQLAELARLMEMHAEFGRAFDYSGGGYGVAVLSRWPLVSPTKRALPSSPHREPRTALTVRVRAGVDGPWLRLTSTHLDSGRNSKDRLVQARYLSEMLVSEEEGISILAGDFNARTDTDVMQAFDVHWTNPFITLPTGTTRRRGSRGDYILFRAAEGWRLAETRVIDDRLASDHRPLLMVLEWIGDR